MNSLQHESSPYLLQHAKNPVYWKPWNKEVLKQAQETEKLMVISIGYAACHWCHVMEHESFEDMGVAEIMNDHFSSIKVDREERPEVDQLYMNAVQLMTGRGGWPLNVVTLPDGRPVWGGTYFRKEEWKSALLQLQKLYEQQPETLHEYATKLEKGIQDFDLIERNENEMALQKFDLQSIVEQWKRNFDLEWGGLRGAPKFMMPSSLEFWLHYGIHTSDALLESHALRTLIKMAQGGLYDAIGGGFARYSVDERWHIPHFEKMLYDNAQLISLYSKAYAHSKNPLFKTVVKETISFLERELKDNIGAFYSSLDADSENENGRMEEGTYYSFTEQELKKILEDDFSLFKEYFNINSFGKWEEDKFVLIRKVADSEFCENHSLSEEDLEAKVKNWKSKLFSFRNKRKKPRLDDKSLTSWNGLALIGLIDAYKIFQEPNYLNLALKNAKFILKYQVKEDGSLFHSYKIGQSTIPGFLEDYAMAISAFISLHEATLDKKWLILSQQLTDYCIEHFLDTKTTMFYFTTEEEKTPVARTMEYRDNVIPASNSIMAHNLFHLSHYFGNDTYHTLAKQMLLNVLPEIEAYPTGFSNWLQLLLKFSQPFYEVVLMGNDAENKRRDLQKEYIPNTLFTGSETDDSLPLTRNRFVSDKTYVYVCKNNSCNLPQTEVSEVLKMLKKEKK
ncbi:thioredoxin domain-containing protein [Flavobacteriaceae bacterium TK19130]|nr:thioredoxin domain-containing protein [Thermobacterium salinum]